MHMPLNQTLNIEEGFWKQKSSSHLVFEGNHNIQYFHAMVHGHRKRLKALYFTKIPISFDLSSLPRAWKVISTPNGIQSSNVSFYQELLFPHSQPMDPIRFGIIPKVVTEVDNTQPPPLIYEIQEVVFSMDVDSSIGLDGFSSLFFQHYWDIIQDNVYKAVLDYFDGGHLLRGFPATSIVLLLKKYGACRWTDLRLIGSTHYITKLLNTNLSSILNIMYPQCYIDSRAPPHIG